MCNGVCIYSPQEQDELAITFARRLAQKKIAVDVIQLDFKAKLCVLADATLEEAMQVNHIKLCPERWLNTPFEPSYHSQRFWQILTMQLAAELSLLAPG